MLLGALAVGQVRAGSTKAEEIVEIVQHRPPGNRPPAFIVYLGCGKHLNIGEGRAGREVELQRSPADPVLLVVELEKAGKGLSDKSAGRRAQQSANARRYVGNVTAPVGLPEPALTRLLIFGEQAFRALLGTLHGNPITLGPHDPRGMAIGEDHLTGQAEENYEARTDRTAEQDKSHGHSRKHHQLARKFCMKRGTGDNRGSQTNDRGLHWSKPAVTFDP